MARTRPLRVNLAANTNRLRSCGKQNNNWRAYLSSHRTTRRLCRKYWPLIRTCCIQITTFWSLQSGKTTTTYTNMCCIYVLRQEVVFRPSLALKWPFKWRILSRTGKIGSGKNTKYFFSYWAWSTPWGHVLSLKTFCQIPALSWAISNSVFQPVKFTK